jgi:hypothetical protein
MRGALSLMFSPLAAGVMLGLMVAIDSQKVVELYSEASKGERFDPDEHDKGPDCAEYIKLEARVCRYCGHEYSDEDVEQQIAQAREDFREKRREGEQDETGTTSVVKRELTAIGKALLVFLPTHWSGRVHCWDHDLKSMVKI